MKLSLIVAMTQNRVIGKDNQMPWHLPAELAWFKQNTLGKPVIMGRKTFQSIGKPLPNRQNIVLSRQPFIFTDVDWANSLESALELAKGSEEIMLIGGGELFKQALPFAEKLYLTEIQTQLEGDTFFPALDTTQWELLYEHRLTADAKNQYDCLSKILQRKVR